MAGYVDRQIASLERTASVVDALRDDDRAWHHESAASGAVAVEVRDLFKRYEDAMEPAVAGASFSISTGEIVALLGPNGAGKSTTIGIITTRLQASSGEVFVGGVSVTSEPARARAAIGVTGQSNTLDSSCTVVENLYLHCRYHGMARAVARERAMELLTRFRLEDKCSVKPEALSGGLARRLQLARAMAHEPILLLLDEPTNELDAPSQALFWQQVGELRSRGDTAVLLATHSLEEAEQHCDRVLIMDSGSIVLEGGLAELRRTYRGANTIEFISRWPVDGRAAREIELLPQVVRCVAEGERTSVLLETQELPLERLVRIIDPFVVEAVSTRQASLREIFMDVVRARA